MPAKNPSFIKQWLPTAGLLAVGLLLYGLFRQDVLFLEKLFGAKEGIYSHLDFSHPPAYFAVYCLPDALWYLALLHTNSVISARFHTQSGSFTPIINLTVICTPFILEFGQWAGFIAGTFDIADIVTYLLILIIYLLWTRKNLGKEFSLWH